MLANGRVGPGTSLKRIVVPAAAVVASGEELAGLLAVDLGDSVEYVLDVLLLTQRLNPADLRVGGQKGGGAGAVEVVAWVADAAHSGNVGAGAAATEAVLYVSISSTQHVL
mgnify:CR=1 FL=1